MIVGVDFDNTLVCYDTVFHKVACEKGLIPEDKAPEIARNKTAVRDYLRSVDGEEDWIHLQGYVYGPRLNDALPYPDSLDFFKKTREAGIETYVVSHKTKKPYRGPEYDLHQYSKEWLKFHGYHSEETGLTPERAFFEVTKEDKIARIKELGCTHFIDDLPEFLSHPEFPQDVQCILFDAHGNLEAKEGWIKCSSWSEIAQLIFNK